MTQSYFCQPHFCRTPFQYDKRQPENLSSHTRPSSPSARGKAASGVSREPSPLGILGTCRTHGRFLGLQNNLKNITLFTINQGLIPESRTFSDFREKDWDRLSCPSVARVACFRATPRLWRRAFGGGHSRRETETRRTGGCAVLVLFPVIVLRLVLGIPLLLASGVGPSHGLGIIISVLLWWSSGFSASWIYRLSKRCDRRMQRVEEVGRIMCSSVEAARRVLREEAVTTRPLEAASVSSLPILIGLKDDSRFSKPNGTFWFRVIAWLFRPFPSSFGAVLRPGWQCPFSSIFNTSTCSHRSLCSMRLLQ